MLNIVIYAQCHRTRVLYAQKILMNMAMRFLQIDTNYSFYSLENTDLIVGTLYAYHMNKQCRINK